MKISNFFVCLALLIFSVVVKADWHADNVKELDVGYDRATIAFRLDGWARTDCICYGTWANLMCLDKTREIYDFEKALLLSARARGGVIHTNIDEATCKVRAIYENN